jgi:hypothetical protein
LAFISPVPWLFYFAFCLLCEIIISARAADNCRFTPS